MRLTGRVALRLRDTFSVRGNRVAVGVSGGLSSRVLGLGLEPETQLLSGVVTGLGFGTACGSEIGTGPGLV